MNQLFHCLRSLFDVLCFIMLILLVRLSFSWMSCLMVLSVITNLSSSLMNLLLCFPSNSWLVITRDSSCDISDSCCSFKAEKWVGVLSLISLVKTLLHKAKHLISIFDLNDDDDRTNLREGFIYNY